MRHVTEALARVRELQNRAARHAPQPGGDFKAALEAASPPGSASSLQGAHRTPPTRQAFTAGQFIGATAPALAPTVTPTIAARPPVDGVLTRTQLGVYLDEVGIAHENGRLTPDQLMPVDGGWNGRPGGLIEPAAIAWERMREAAAEEGLELHFVDAYRSWEAQHAAHQRYLRGEKNEHVLPAGTSQHGVGLALDITNGTIIDRSDPEWDWLQVNAPAFGWWPIANETWHWEFRGT